MSNCRNCLLPEGVFDVVLDEQGTCNYCDFYEKHRAMFADPAALEARLREKLDTCRGQYDYDAMVGISGGKDSAYVLCTLIEKYGLKVLAVTYENGFLTDYAKRNVEQIVKTLGVEHEYYYPNWNVHREFYRAALMKFGDPCLACFISGYFIAIKKCHERRIPFFVHGRSPYQMLMNFREGTRDLFLPIMQLNMEPHSFEKTAAAYRQLHEQLKGWVGNMFDDPGAAQKVFDEFFIDASMLTGEFTPEFLALFLFEPYDEEKIKQEMEKKVGYERPANDGLLTHGDCGIHDVAGFLYEKVRGLKITAPEVAVMLRRGDIGKDEAEKLLAREGANGEAVEASVACICDRLGMDRSEFEALAAALERATSERFDVSQS